MALGATIYKVELHIADMVRNYYDSHALTLARHPSETDERLMLRVLLFALLADEGLVFTRGLSTTEEPALWQKDLTGRILNWVEVGRPDERRLLQAGGKSDRVTVCCVADQAGRLWWQGVQAAAARVRGLRVIAPDAVAVRALAGLARRSMRLHVSIQEGQALVASDEDSVTLDLEDWR